MSSREPVIPVLPVLSGDTFGNARAEQPSLLDAPELLETTSGRIAIAEVVRLLGIGAGESVLMPAYHCTTMVDPIDWLGVRPRYYRLRTDLRVDIEDIKANIDDTTRALLVVHYFGFPQQMDRLRALCDEYRISLIEDCAHAMFGQWLGRPIGSYGDYAIGSFPKFFATPEGGCIATWRHDALPKQRAGSFLFELKTFMDAIEVATQYARLPALKWLIDAKVAIRKVGGRPVRQVPTGRAVPDSAEGGTEFEPEWLGVRCSWTSRAVIQRSDTKRVTDRRRDHFKRLLEHFDGTPGCHPLHHELEKNVVPYMFPLCIDKGAEVYAELRRRSVPVYRWDSLATDRCPVSNSYAQNLVQIACHQELGEAEVEWIAEEVRGTINSAR